jgi:hypothetical protein
MQMDAAAQVREPTLCELGLSYRVLCGVYAGCRVGLPSAVASPPFSELAAKLDATVDAARLRQEGSSAVNDGPRR